tara:strand:- start:548 stop:1609 length:1062 start_codon:yes stop_codon:yes gene_type:complete
MKVTFILPIRNEEEYIENTIKSIINQSSNEEKELIFADGMSNDNTRIIIKKYQEIYPYLQIIDNPENIVSTGFNRALSISKGDIIIRVDGHSKIDYDFVKNCLKILKDKNVDCVGGPTKHIGNGLIGDSIKIAQSSIFGSGGVSFRATITKGEYVDTLAFGAYKRKVFSSIGGYDEELIRNQDDEFNFRLNQTGSKIWLDPSIQSYYYTRNSFFKLFKQYFQYGFYKMRVVQKRRGFASWRHLVPGIFTLFLSISFVSFLNSWNTWFFYFISGSYLIANIISAIYELAKGFTSEADVSIKPFILLPFTFLILHLAYGLGFLIGFIYFINKWKDIQLIDNYFDKEKFNNNIIIT